MEIFNKLKPAQDEADTLRVVHNGRFIDINGAPGAGKSTYARLQAIRDTYAAGRLCVIIVPKVGISEGFSDASIMVDGHMTDITPFNNIGNGANKLKQAAAFLVDAYDWPEAERTMIVSYQTFIALYRHRRELLTNLLIVFDEAHHAAINENGSYGNELAEAFYETIRNDESNYAIRMTATDFRADAGSLTMPDWYREARECYVYHMSRFFSDNKVVKSVSANIHFYTNVDKYLVEYLTARIGNKIAFILPPVMSSSRLDNDKMNSVERVKNAIKRVTGATKIVFDRGVWLFTKAGTPVYRLGDIVNDEHRDRVYKMMKHGDRGELDGVVSLETMIEGVDWKHCDTVAMLGPRRSPPQINQLAGRAIRDVAGKPRDAKVDVFIPQLLKLTTKDEHKQTRQVNAYLNDLCQIMATNTYLNPKAPAGFRKPAAPRKGGTPQATAMERVFPNNPEAYTKLETAVRQRAEQLAKTAKTPADQQQIMQDLVGETESLIHKFVPGTDAEDAEELAHDVVAHLKRLWTVKEPKRMGRGSTPDDLIEKLVINGDIRQYFGKAFDTDLLKKAEESFTNSYGNNWPPEDVFMAAVKGMSYSQYINNNGRSQLIVDRPEYDWPSTPNTVYNISNAELFGTTDDNKLYEKYPPIDVCKKLLSGWTGQYYKKNKHTLPQMYYWPDHNVLSNHFNVSWTVLTSVLSDAAKHEKYPPIEVAQSLVAGWSKTHYAANKNTLDNRYYWPVANTLAEHYGISWSELANTQVDTDLKSRYAPLKVCKKVLNGFSREDYKKNKHTLSKQYYWPDPGNLATHHNTTWSEITGKVADKNKSQGYPSLKEFMKFVKGMSVMKYNKVKPKSWGSNIAMTKFYGKLWSELSGKA